MGEYTGKRPGEFIYEYALQFTQVGRVWIPANPLFSGSDAASGRGARGSTSISRGLSPGPNEGDGGKGWITFTFVADGPFAQLHIHAGSPRRRKKISLAADGVGIPQQGSPVIQLRGN